MSFYTYIVTNHYLCHDKPHCHLPLLGCLTQMWLLLHELLTFPIFVISWKWASKAAFLHYTLLQNYIILVLWLFCSLPIWKSNQIKYKSSLVWLGFGSVYKPCKQLKFNYFYWQFMSSFCGDFEYRLKHISLFSWSLVQFTDPGGHIYLPITYIKYGWISWKQHQVQNLKKIRLNLE